MRIKSWLFNSEIKVVLGLAISLQAGQNHFSFNCYHVFLRRYRRNNKCQKKEGASVQMLRSWLYIDTRFPEQILSVSLPEKTEHRQFLCKVQGESWHVFVQHCSWGRVEWVPSDSLPSFGRHFDYHSSSHRTYRWEARGPADQAHGLVRAKLPICLPCLSGPCHLAQGSSPLFSSSSLLSYFVPLLVFRGGGGWERGSELSTRREDQEGRNTAC